MGRVFSLFGRLVTARRVWYVDRVPYSDHEKRRAYGREWIRRHPEKAREAMRRWRERHPEEHNADSRAYYARHKKRLADYFAAYRRSHREVRQASDARRRAGKLGRAGSYTAAEWIGVMAAWHWRCAYCGGSGPLEADHRVALSRGGSTAIENIVPACPSCNARKHRLSEDEFCARLRSEGRRIRPALRLAACPKHREDEGREER